MLYLYLKALHLIAVICWFAGLFYLPRLFIYHLSATDDLSHQRFCTMERRLYTLIMRPAMITTLLLGIALVALAPAQASQSWFSVKMLALIVLLGYHHLCGRYLRQLAGQRLQRSERFLRFFNELPVILLIIMVIMVIVKPF